jgi:dihydroorotate dehydrogenase electron transfer subunit
VKGYPAEILSRDAICATPLVWLRCPEIAAAAQPGQFIMVDCGRDFLLRRPLSIHDVNGDDIAILFTVMGGGTSWLAELEPGATLNVMGPLGNGYTVSPGSKRLLLVAGGIGIAPLVFLARHAASQGHRVTLLMGAYSATQLYPETQLALEIDCVTATETGDNGRLVTELLPDYAPEADQVFACGPAAMYRAMAARREALGLMGKSVQVSLEVRMACGFGVCYGCTVKTRQGLKQVCRHGPVFEMDDILWDKFPTDI